VNDLLDISCIEAGKLALTLEPIDPRAIFDSTLPLVAVQAASKDLRLVDETQYWVMKSDFARFC
jgi:hypothetical protein